MLAIFSFRQKVEVLHHDQWWDFVGFLPLSSQTKTCHCLKAVPWGHVMGFGGRPIRFPSECKSFRSVLSRLRPTVRHNLFRVVGVSKFTTAVTRKMNHFSATAVAKAVPLQENFHSGTSKQNTTYKKYFSSWLLKWSFSLSQLEVRYRQAHFKDSWFIFIRPE